MRFMLEFDIGYVLCLGEIVGSLRNYESMPKLVERAETNNYFDERISFDNDSTYLFIKRARGVRADFRKANFIKPNFRKTSFRRLIPGRRG